MMDKVFPIIKASNGALWCILGFVILFVVFIALFAFIAYSIKNIRVELTDQGLRIKGGIYGRFISKEVLSKERARILDLNIEEQYRPRIRTNGIGLPGYSEGWFKLRNGEKALLYVTERSNVVYIPTTKGYSVLLSVSQPTELLNSMNEFWR